MRFLRSIKAHKIFHSSINPESVNQSGLVFLSSDKQKRLILLFRKIISLFILPLNKFQHFFILYDISKQRFLGANWDSFKDSVSNFLLKKLSGKIRVPELA